MCIANGLTVLRRRRTGRFHSTVPLIGAGFLGAGLFLLPATRMFCWMALVLDFGTFELLIALPKIFSELWSTSGWNLMAEYQGSAGNKSVCLRLFRRSVFTMRLQIQRPPGECGLTQAGTIGTWRRDGMRLTLKADGGEAVFEVRGVPGGEALRQTTGFPAWAGSEDRDLNGIELSPTGNRSNSQP